MLKILKKVQFPKEANRMKSIANTKIARELYYSSKSKNLKFYIADMDSGVGFLQKTKDKFIYTKIDNLKDLRFIDYLKIYKQLPVIKAEKALHKIVNG